MAQGLFHTDRDRAQFRAYALGYLESSEMVTRNLIAEGRASDFVVGSTAHYLARHAVELFVKGALLHVGVDVKDTHSLEKLAKSYVESFPGPEYAWNIPFRTQVVGAEEVEAREMIQKHDKANPGDQVPRYPGDKQLKPWSGLSAFDAKPFLSLLSAIRSDFTRLSESIYG